MKKIRPIKSSCHDWLITYISDSIKSAAGFKEKVTSLFKTNTPKQTVYGKGKKLSKLKTLNKIRNPLTLKKEKKKLKEQ